MYHMIVRRNLRNSFAAINEGNYGAIVKQFAPANSEHWFSGSHPLAGRRDNMAEIQQWYDRLAVIFPTLRFEITKMVVGGWPWDTVAMIEWVDHVTDCEGNRFSNQGVHVIRLQWAKVTELHVYCDTQMLADICHRMADQGLAEAGAEPIGAAVPFAVADKRRA